MVIFHSYVNVYQRVSSSGFESIDSIQPDILAENWVHIPKAKHPYVCQLYNVNPGLINKPLGCLIGGVPFKYQIMTIGGIPPN